MKNKIDLGHIWTGNLYETKLKQLNELCSAWENETEPRKKNKIEIALCRACYHTPFNGFWFLQNHLSLKTKKEAPEPVEPIVSSKYGKVKPHTDELTKTDKFHECAYCKERFLSVKALYGHLRIHKTK